MRLFRILSLGILLSLASGCTLLESLSGDVSSKVENYIRQKQYARAMDLIEYVGPGNKQYAQLQKRKKQLQQIIRTYEIRTIANARTLARKEEWHKALLVLEHALQNLPKSTKLKNSYDKISLQRESVLQEIDIQLALNHASKLARDIPLLEKTVQIIPSQAENRYSLDDHDQDRQKTTQLLISCAEKGIKEKRYTLAEKCVKAGYGMQPNKQEKQQLDIINSKIIQYIHRQQGTELENASELLNKLKQGYSYDNLNDTREMIVSLGEHRIQSKKHKHIIHQLNSHLKKGIAQRIETGQQLYSAGKIQEALVIWHELVSIDPDNTQLQAYIERAERVLDKLQTLSKEQESSSQ